MHVQNLAEAATRLIRTLEAINEPQVSDRFFEITVSEISMEQFLCSVRTTRFCFKSRDQDLIILGLGIADIISGPDALEKFALKRASLRDQYYFAATRFDEEHECAAEWKNFGSRFLVLPIVSLHKKNGHEKLMLNFKADGLCWEVWLDHAISILHALCRPNIFHENTDYDRAEYLPTKADYSLILEKTLEQFNETQKKVVLGRRAHLKIKKPVDPAKLFLRLKGQNAFLFFIDLAGTAFFGASPELLYRKVGEDFATESLAGTRARALDEKTDAILKEELKSNPKDNHEHSLVSLYIEEKLKKLECSWSSSPLEVKALSYVQHLLKRYSAKISPNITDAQILNCLHPTPAVCGLDKDWAKAYIRENEAFDRGFYAGALGILGQDESEFCVGIRSALYFEQNLYIYVASGIVPGSSMKEWEELSHKEKNMLSIFDER